MSVIKTILNKISIDKSCYIFIILAILSARFQIVLLISLLLLIHECGHFFTALLFKWHTEKIVFYPFGGISKFSHDINCSLKEEILVLLMGPIMQLIGYYFLLSLDIFINYYQVITTINYSILIFNLLPIYPLDGGRILKSILSLLCNKQKANIYINRISNIILFIITFVFSLLIYYYKNIGIVLITIYLWYIVLKENRIYNMKLRIHKLIMNKNSEYNAWKR